jgi:hypothetical protein
LNKVSIYGTETGVLARAEGLGLPPCVRATAYPVSNPVDLPFTLALVHEFITISSLGIVFTRELDTAETALACLTSITSMTAEVSEVLTRHLVEAELASELRIARWNEIARDVDVGSVQC